MAKDGPGTLPEPLTQREQNILAYLANDQSSQEIARLETLAYSSVKWYIHQIYAKLGVNRRSDAIARARELGLLRPEAASLDDAWTVKNNLPRQLTSFIGREEEVKLLLALVEDLPLVTLTGSGGTGKTRLAMQVAGRALEAFPDGAWWVELAPLADPKLVPLVTATALGMRAIPNSPVTQVISEFIGRKSLLLILDNCEHLIGAAASLASELLHACPALHILATSRDVLGIDGEKTFRCPPLSLPDPQSQPTFQELSQSEAVRLFAERAQTASSGFRLSEANAAVIARICRRLDGIPLAIELAAVRLRLLSVDQIAARLDDVFHLLTGGGRTALPRHQTLKALVDWSYNLLSEKERRLLRRLSVFAGSWTLEAAEAVCADAVEGDPLPAEEILDLLGKLVDKSLVSVKDEGAEPRYHMLEMIRQYAAHRLLEGGGDEALREQHLDYYLALSLEAELHLRARCSREWKERLDAEIGNLRLAMEWSISGPIEKGLRLAAALQWFWNCSRYRIEGVGWLNRLLDAEANEGERAMLDAAREIRRNIARGKALNACAYTGIIIGRDEQGLAAEAATIFKSLGNLCAKDLAYSLNLSGEISLLDSLEMFRKIGDLFFIGEVLVHLCQASRWKGELVQARAYVEENLRLNREIGDQDGESAGLWELGMVEFLEGNLEQAREDFQASQACLFESGNEEFHPFLYRFYAWIALVQGDVQQAIGYSQAQLTAASEHFIPWMMADALGFLGWEALTNGDEDRAIHYCEEAMKLKGRVENDLLSLVYYVLARVALSRGEHPRARSFLKAFVTVNYYSWPPVQLGIQIYGIMATLQMAERPDQARRAATLFGALDEINGYLLNVIPIPEQKAYEQAIKALRGALCAEDFAAAWAEGQAMTTDQAIQYALEEEEQDKELTADG